MSKKYTILMAASFGYGGFCLLTYVLMVYSAVWGEEIAGLRLAQDLMFVSREVPGPAMNIEQIGINNSNYSIDNNHSVTFTPRRALRRQPDIIAIITSPNMLLLLIGGMISIANGLAIRHITREREVRKARAEVTQALLSPEEKQFIDELQKASGELTQRNLTEITGYSRVKTHRILQRLEAKKLVRKIANGQTNRIVLEKE